MGESATQRIAYLALDAMAADPGLARRLPADLAWRFHALPLAEDNGRVTVVMADPNNAEARNAVMTALGQTPCVVQGDPVTIDALLAEIWANKVIHQPRLLACAFPDRVAETVYGYALAISDLLDARLDRVSDAAGFDALVERPGPVGHDLIVLGEPDYQRTCRVLSRAARRAQEPKPPGAVPPAVLLARRPRWPLRRILLLVCGNEEDRPALDWVLRLARQSRSAVTILAIVPPVPGMYGQRAAMNQSLPALLTTETLLGRQMRYMAQQLGEHEIEGTLRLRQGAFDLQLQHEAARGKYDLIAAGAKPCGWWRRCLEGDLIDSLLRWVDRPVLIARSTTV
jgi:hypothetical protein